MNRLRRGLVVVLLLCVSLWLALPAPAAPPVAPAAGYASDRVLVKFTPTAALSAMGRENAVMAEGLTQAMERAQVKRAAPLFADLWTGTGAPVQAASVRRSVRARFAERAARAMPEVASPDLENILVLSLESGADVATAVAELRKAPGVVYAEPDYKLAVTAVPNDPYYSSSGSWGQSYADMWGLNAISAASGWDVTTGSASVVMAVVDTGVDYTHPELSGRLWSNPGEIAGNGTDDDGNGYVDDVMGWNFVDDTNDPLDGFGHGTHVSGTMAAATNNGAGIAGLNWFGKLMPVKGLSDVGEGYTENLGLAMRYAADNGADVMNNSWGGYGISEVLQDVVNHCYALGCIVVASAGNSAYDTQYFEPAGLRNVVSVSALAPGDGRADFSNYGSLVDLAAPGVDVLSLLASGTDMYGDGLHYVGTGYYRSDGTSMAAPHVSGALGLLIAAHPAWTTAQLVGQLAGASDDIDSGNSGYVGQVGLGRINLTRALTESSVRKRVVLLAATMDDSLGDDDGVMQAGERIQVIVTLKNFAGESPALTATLTTTDSHVAMVNGAASFGDISGWRTISNAASPFVFDLTSDWKNDRPLVFNLHIVTTGYTRDEVIRLYTAAGYGYAYWSYPAGLAWGQTSAALLEVDNYDTFDWTDPTRYHFVTPDGLNRWGVASLELPVSLYIGEYYILDLPLTGPPVATIGYTPPVLDTTVVGNAGTLNCAYEFHKDLEPMAEGLASQQMVVSRFTDTLPDTAGAWARFYVEECAGRLPAIVTGYADGSYRPSVDVTRDTMAVYMARALKLPLNAYQGLFTDVPSDYWAALSIEAVADAGVASGYDGGTYRPTDPVTRDQMAVYIARGVAGGDANVPAGPAAPSFSDVSTSYWAFKYVEYVKLIGAASGYADGSYRPTLIVTRDQMAVYIYRAFLRSTPSPVVIAGPALTSYDPSASGAVGWAELASGSATDPGYAYIGFDAIRLGTSVAYGGTWEIKFELRPAAAPDTAATGDYTSTISLSTAAITAAQEAAKASGYPYLVASWDIPSGLAAGSYVLVVSAEDETGTRRESGRRVAFTIN